MGWIIGLLIIGWLVHFFLSSHRRGLATKDTPSGQKIRFQIETETHDLDTDDWNVEAEYAPSNPKSISAHLKLNYEDSKGDSSERIVDVKECDTSNPAGYLIGFCHMRNAIRTFRMDRIKKAIDLDTGEVITNLPDYAAKKYADSPVFSIEGLLKDSMDALRGLFYIAKADGRFTAKEKMVFLEYCHTASGDGRINIKDIENVCKHLPTPSMQAFKLICGRLAKLEDERRQLILSLAEKIIATERTIAPEEEEAIAYMKKRLTPAT